MKLKRQIMSRSNLKAIGLIVLIILSNCVLAQRQQIDAKPERYRVFSFRNIPADYAQQFLKNLAIGTVSKLPDSEVVLVTAPTSGLIKASAILKLIDSKSIYKHETLAVSDQIAKIPDNEILAEKIDHISIGTFANPPVPGAGDMAIIDVHDDALIIIATAGVIEKVRNCIQQINKTETSDPNAAAVSQDKPLPVDNKISDEMFDNLMDSLAEADQKAKELGIDDTPTQDIKPVELESRSLQSSEKIQIPETDLETSGMLVIKQNNDGELVVAPPKEVKETADIEGVIESDPNQNQPPQRPESQKRTRSRTAKKADTENKTAQPENANAVQPTDENPYEPDTTALADQELELNLPEQVDIIELLDFAGKYLDISYFYDPELVKGKVALRLQRKVKVKELYPLIESVLKYKGFVMTRRGDLVTIVPEDRMLDIDPDIQTEGQKPKYGDAIITRVFKLQNIDTTSAKNLLDNMQLGTNITAVPESGTLIVTGFAYRMLRIETLLNMVDQPGKAKMFKFKKLKYTMATTLAPQIKELAEQLGAASVTISQQVSDTPATSSARRPSRTSRRVPTPKTPTRTTPTEPSPNKPEIFLDADERTNRILMIGLKDQLEEVERIIQALDVEQQDMRSIVVYDIINVGAEDVSEKLAELGITSTARQSTYSASRSRSTRSRITNTQSKTPTTPGVTTAADESPEEEPQVVIIESTNSLLVNATPDQQNKIASIIAYVDSEMLEQEIPYVIYSLENQDPEDLAESLQKLIEKTTKDKEGKVQQTVKMTDDDIVIVPDKNTFSLIVYASKRNQIWIKNLIKNLDRRRPQVLINVALVEITRSDQFQYDLDVITNMQDLVSENVGITGAIAGATNAFEAGWGDGELSGFYSNNRIQALFKAMEEKSYGRILAQPKILVNDNEEGSISTVTTTHVEEKSITYAGEDNSTALESSSFKAYDAKIELTITPNISEGDLLRLEVEMAREDFKNWEPGQESPPDLTTSNVATIVTVPDGSTIILGGLTKLNQSKGASKVPLLGDVPLVGNLFRAVGNSDDASMLYIFVKANILRPEDTVGMNQLKEISKRNKVEFEFHEKKFQEREEFVGIDPKPMQPINVLEQE